MIAITIIATEVKPGMVRTIISGNGRGTNLECDYITGISQAINKYLTERGASAGTKDVTQEMGGSPLRIVQWEIRPPAPDGGATRVTALWN